MIPSRCLKRNYILIFVHLVLNFIQLKISLFKLGKNKRFNYNPRYYKEKSIKNSIDGYSKIMNFDSVYSKNRNIRSSADISSKWKEARLTHRNRSNRKFSSRIIIIALVLLLIFLFIIDFDFSIFN